MKGILSNRPVWGRKENDINLFISVGRIGGGWKCWEMGEYSNVKCGGDCRSRGFMRCHLFGTRKMQMICTWLILCVSLFKSISNLNYAIVNYPQLLLLHNLDSKIVFAYFLFANFTDYSLVAK